MKLFKGHAVLPLVGHARTHVVRTYVTFADTWGEARARIREEEPSAVFVTTPVETPAPLLAGTSSMDERELADLRSADEWYEKQALDAAARKQWAAGLE
jgi:arylsulfatase A-like enzyme